MAFDAFIKIDGIEGESTDDAHQGWIEIRKYGIGLYQKISTTASSTGGATAERANFKDFKFTKLFDKSTPKLSLYCANGTHIDNATIELCRAGGDKIKYMEYKLSNCLISSINAVADGRGFPDYNGFRGTRISPNIGQYK